MNTLTRLIRRNPARSWVHRNIIIRTGRRGAFLAFLALLDLLYGWSLYTAPAAQRRSLNLILPWQAWGITWAAVGVIMLTGVAARRDILQFTLAVLLKTAWGMTYVNVWLAHEIASAWTAAVIWLAFAGIVVIVAGWAEPARPDTVLFSVPNPPGARGTGQ